MAYRYNSWKHSLLVEYNTRARQWECFLRSAYSGRKLKVYCRGGMDACQAACDAVKRQDLAK